LRTKGNLSMNSKKYVLKPNVLSLQYDLTYFFLVKLRVSLSYLDELHLRGHGLFKGGASHYTFQFIGFLISSVVIILMFFSQTTYF